MRRNLWWIGGIVGGGRLMMMGCGCGGGGDGMLIMIGELRGWWRRVVGLGRLMGLGLLRCAF